MVNEIIAQGIAVTAEYDISAFDEVTVYCRGGTGTYTLEIGPDINTLLQHSTPAVDTINTITDKAIILKVTINATPGAYDIIGQRR